MSGPYRAPERPAESDEPIPDFGNRPVRKLVELATAFVVSALVGVGLWLDHHDVGLALLLSAPAFLVVAAIVLLQAPVREWRARRRARGNVAAMSALETGAADQALPHQPHVRIAADVSAEPEPASSHDEIEAAEDLDDQPARRSRSTRGS